MNPERDSPEPMVAWRRLVPRILRGGVALIVAIGVGRRFWTEHERLATVAHHFEFSWLVLAGITYVVALSTCALYWWWAIRDQGERPGMLATWAAYFAGHLGKYVPGKGLVVVIRAALLRDSNVSLRTGAVSCAHETLLMMATGALVSVLLSPTILGSYRRHLAAVALVVLVGLGIPALPPSVARWSRWVTRPFVKQVDAPQYMCRWLTVLRGIVVIACGWFLMGLSLAAVLVSMESWAALSDRLGVMGALGLLTAAVALATVGGFLSFLPGGLGSREWILIETLGPALGLEGTADAAVAAVLLRVVWIVAEVAGTALFWLLDRQWKNRRTIVP